MKLKKIFFATDLSDFGNAGLPLATALARDRQAELVVLHVQEPTTAYAAGSPCSGLLESDTDMLRQMLETIKPSDSNVVCNHKMAWVIPLKKSCALRNRKEQTSS